MHVLYSYVCITSFACKDYETYTEIVYSFMLTYITCTVKHQSFQKSNIHLQVRASYQTRKGEY